jgi:hypothetical protein
MPGRLPRRVGWRTALVRWLILLCVLALGGAIWLILRAKGATTGYVLPTAAEEVMAGLGLWIALQVVLWIAMVLWTRAAVVNADAIRPDERRIGPNFAALYWVLPPFFLFQPVRVMSQTWNTSVDRADHIDGPAAAPVAGWWLCCAIGVVWLPLSLQTMMADPTLEAIYAHIVSVGGALVFWIGGLGALASVVKTIARAQTNPSHDPTPDAAQPA